METSKEYTYARKIAAVLRRDPDLRDIMHKTLFDDGSQTADIITAAQAPKGVITITPGAEAPAYARDPGGILFSFDAEFALTVWTLDNMAAVPSGLSSAAEYRSALVERCLALIKQAWAANPYTNFTLPEIRSIDDFLIQQQKIPNLAARSIVLAIRINH